MRALAKIPWPAPEPVDLLAEFGATLVGDVPARPALASAVHVDAKLRRLQAASPYTRPVVARDVKVPLTHAQVAAKRVRHFALKHLAFDVTTNQTDSTPETMPLTHAAASERAGSDAFDLQTWLRDANACAMDPQTNVLHATAAATPLLSIPTTSPPARTLHAPAVASPPKRKRPRRRPSPRAKLTKAVHAPDEDDDDDGSAIDDIQDTEYIPPFEHLEPQDISTMQHKRAGTKSPNKELRRAKSFHIAKWLTKRIQERAYSKEMQSRLAATLSANVGGGLWKDQVASQLATAMSADVVFGDGSDGNGRPFADDAAALAAVLEREWIATKARDVHDRATTEYANGHVPEALSILSAGAALLQATTAAATHKSSWGFNYTLEVHAKASLLQMLYRRRHLRRARAALRLQTVWRGFHDRRRFKRRLWHRQASALYIQRWWHVRTADKEAMRLRLQVQKQTAARRKLAYLLVRRMRKAHKVLRASIHAWLVCALARLRLRRAIRAATNMQRLVRGFLSRRAVLRLRDRIVRDEVARSSREADYIQRCTAIRLEDFLLFLHQAGQRHVHQLAQRLKDEATARKRARAHWPPAAMRRAALEDLFASYDVDGSGTIDVDELQHLFDELCIPMDAASLAHAIRLMDTSRNGSVDVNEFCAYLEAPQGASNAGLWKLHAQLQLQRVANWFTSATFKNEARRRLVYDETQRQARLLRTEFRAAEHPRFACPYCGAAFALYRPFWRHTRQRQCPAASKRRLDSAHQVDADDDDLAAVEQALVDARLVEVERDVALYMATSPGKADLAADATRLQQRYLALRQRRKCRDLAHDSNAILELYHSYDMAETNALPALLLPDIAADAGLGRAELASHFATDHDVTMDEVYDAVRRAYASLSWPTRLQQLLPSFLFTSSRRQRRLRQAATCLLLREKALAETTVRAAFRLAHPPVLVCQACNTGLWHDARARLHLQDDRFHMRDASHRHRRDARIHLTATSTSRLVQLTQLSQDAVRAQAMQKALRFCKRQEGRRAIHAVTKHLLTQLAPQTAVNEPRRLLDVAFQLIDVDRVGSIPAESVAPVLAFLQCTGKARMVVTLQPPTERVRRSTLERWVLPLPPPKTWTFEAFWRHRRATALATHVVATTYLQSKATLDVVPHVDVHAYLATPVGRQAIADEEALFCALQTTTTTDLIALVLQQLDVDRSRRIRVEHLATLLHVLGYAHATRTAATLRSAVPASDGHVPSDTLRAWLTAHPPRRCMLGRRWRLRCVRTRLARAVVTARYEGSAAACAPDPISHDALLVAKSEHFSKSALGRDAIQTKVAELQRLEKVFAASTKGVRGHAWRSARARFLFRLFERGHAGAIELVDVPCVLRDLCHPLQKDPNVMARMLRFLNLEATSTTTISETAFHRWLDTDAGRARSRRLAWRPSTKALATAVVRFEHRSDLGQRDDDVLPLHVLAKADAYCASVAGQHEIDEEETHVQAQLGQHRRKTRGLAALEHKVAYAALLFRLVDANDTGRVAAHALSTLLGLLQLPNDLPLAHCIARDVGDATGHLDEAAFLAWYRGALDRQSLRTRLLAALRQTPVRAIATAVVAARHRQSLEQPTEPSEGSMVP